MSSIFKDYDDAMTFIALSVLESSNPDSGWSEIMAVIGQNNVLKLVRLMPGMNIRIPTMTELSYDLTTSLYIYCKYIYKMSDADFKIKYNVKDMRVITNRYKRWLSVMNKNNIDPESFLKKTLLLVK